MKLFKKENKITESARMKIENAIKQFNEKRKTEYEDREIPLTLEINENTDVCINLKRSILNEKIIKISEACKNKSSWQDRWFSEKPKSYYRFLFLTTQSLFAVPVSYNKDHRRWDVGYDPWKAGCKHDFYIEDRHLISAYAKKVRGLNSLIINYRNYQNQTFQIKYPVENPDEWVKEINAVIEKAR